MEENKAKELIETGMARSIEFGERIHGMANSLMVDNKLTAWEVSNISNCLLNFESVRLSRFISDLHDRGSEFDAMRDEINGISNYLLAGPNLAIESLIECTLPEAIDQIAHMNIPPDCSHILKVLGWQRRDWTIEKLEAGLVTEARRRIRRSRKGNKK